MILMREKRRRIAHETLRIQQQGFYLTSSGKRVDIAAAQKASEKKSRLITPNEGQELVGRLTPLGVQSNTAYKVINASTVKVVIDEAKSNYKVAALNFASARSPGGGFLSGAMAQEEAIAASSGLYSTQLLHGTYYEKNRRTKSMMYTDHAIYSPDVVFFRDETNNLLENPITCSILTLPAVNMGQVKAKGEDISTAKQTMKNRMRLAIAILAHERNHTIILGAYGCGVFGNDPNDVAEWWYEILCDEKCGSYFHCILFAVLDMQGGRNISAFEKVFKNLCESGHG